MIGLADVPTEVLVDLVSAGRALGHPHPPLNTLPKRRQRRSKSDEDRASDRRDAGPDEVPGHFRSTLYGENGVSSGELDDDEDEEEEMLSDDDQRQSPMEEAEINQGVTHLGDSYSEGGVERTRSLQLERSQSMSSELAPSQSHNLLSDMVAHGGRMSKKLVNLIIWLPTDFSMSLSKGFHNAPKLWHDPMVKPTPKVIGVRSGFKAAGKVYPLTLFFVDYSLTTKIGTLRWVLLWYHRSCHSTSVWIQAQGHKRDAQRVWQRSRWGVLQAASRYETSSSRLNCVGSDDFDFE